MSLFFIGKLFALDDVERFFIIKIFIIEILSFLGKKKQFESEKN